MSEIQLLSDERIRAFVLHAADRIPASDVEGRVIHAVRLAEEAVRAQWAAEVNELTDVLFRNGFVRCDISACNCGSWHARFGYPERFREFTDALEEHGANLHAGKTALTILKEMLSERDAAQAELQGADNMLEALNEQLLAAKADAARVREALQTLLPMFEQWHRDFPDDVGHKEGPALAAARAALQPKEQG